MGARLKANGLYEIVFGDLHIGTEQIEILNQKIIFVAHFFNFDTLPEEFKIKLHIFSDTQMKKYKEDNKIGFSQNLFSFTFDGDKICILDYEEIKNVISVDAYISLLVHEFVHVFQGYFSRIPPKKYVWLYEIVACYLSNQSNRIPKNFIKVTWEKFVTDFYSVEHCYTIAYMMGERIFDIFSKEEILNLIKAPQNYIDVLKDIYQKYF